MYEMPGRTDVAKCIITREVVEKRDVPLLVTTQGNKSRAKKQKEETA
jgi:ATP-dependent Clp protease ATP-binding subunit ClpX